MVTARPAPSDDDRPTTLALLRAAIDLRLDDAPESASLLTAALWTLCQEAHASGSRAEHLVLALRGAWADATKSRQVSDAPSRYLFNSVLDEALVIFFADEP